MKQVYKAPIMVKMDKMQFPTAIINKNGKGIVCKQCSSCHSCR